MSLQFSNRLPNFVMRTGLQRQHKASPSICNHHFPRRDSSLSSLIWPVSEGNLFPAPVINMQILIFRRRAGDEKRKPLYAAPKHRGRSFLVLLAERVPLTAISLKSNVQSELVTVAITSVQVRINWITGWLPCTPRWANQSRPVCYTDPLSPSSIFM